jgi:hypothetical protein
MKAKIVLLGVAVVLVIALVAGGVWWMMRPQVIVFSDDATLTLVKVEYGKKHSPPNVKPPSGTNRPAARARGGTSFTTTNDTLVVWVHDKHDSKQYHYFQFYLYDKDGTACVQAGPRMWRNNGNEDLAIQFDAFPRRQGKFFIAVEEQGNGGQEMSDKKFVISNPAHKSYSKWEAEPVPTTKTDDDLAVTLTKFIYGAPNTYTRNEVDADDAINKSVQATFHVERDGKPVTNWQPVTVTTTDATGNEVRGWNNQNNWQNGDDMVTYQYGLWPDEAAWKLRLEFSQQSDFADDELWSVKSLPVVPGKQQEMYNNPRRANTNSVFAEKDLNGFHLKLFPAKDFTDAGNNNWMQGGLFIQVSPDLGEGWRMTVKASDDQNNELQCSDYGNSRNNSINTYRYRLGDSAGLTNLNVSIALHKSRFVEFTAKPDKAPAVASTQ